MPVKEIKWKTVFPWMLAAVWPGLGFPSIPETFAGLALALAACLALLRRGHKGGWPGNAIQIFQISAQALAQYAAGGVIPSLLQG